MTQEWARFWDEMEIEMFRGSGICLCPSCGGTMSVKRFRPDEDREFTFTHTMKHIGVKDSERWLGRCMDCKIRVAIWSLNDPIPDVETVTATIYLTI